MFANPSHRGNVLIAHKATYLPQPRQVGLLVRHPGTTGNSTGGLGDDSDLGADTHARRGTQHR